MIKRAMIRRRFLGTCITWRCEHCRCSWTYRATETNRRLLMSLIVAHECAEGMF